MSDNEKRALSWLKGQVPGVSPSYAALVTASLGVLLDEAEARGRVEERARIVAWLRYWSEADRIREAADAIERGEADGEK